MAEITRRMHHGGLPVSKIFQPAWDAFTGLLDIQRLGCRQSFQEWGCLPEHLVAQLDDFLLPVDELLDSRSAPT